MSDSVIDGMITLTNILIICAIGKGWQSSTWKIGAI